MSVRILVSLVSVGVIVAAFLSPLLVELRAILRTYFVHASVMGHMALFAGLAGTLFLAWGRAAPWRVVLGVVGLAIVVEWAQSFVPNRSVEVQDFMANGVGVCLGLGLAWGWQRLRHVGRDARPAR